MAIALGVLVAQPGFAQDRATLLILDGSGSMWGQLDEGRSRIEVARDVLGDFLATRDPSGPLGVVAYGHNRRGDCSDIETIAPVAVQDGAALGQRLRRVMPLGKTPLADALRRAAAALPPTAETADIVLITDGLETCGGDPCAVAAEIAAQGVAVRAHVVGFALSEGEVEQIACVAEETGGLVLEARSGADLAEALLRTAAPVTRAAEAAGRVPLDVTIDSDEAGRPDVVSFRAENLDTGEAIALGTLDFASAWTLPVELDAGRWRLLAEAGEAGSGALEVTVAAADNRTIVVPFTGRLPAITLDQLGPYRAGASAVFPLRILREGLATGGADFVLTLLPQDAGALDDRPVTWSGQGGGLGAWLPWLNLPAEPGRYRVAWHRYGETELSAALVLLDIDVAARPEVTLAAPAVVAPGAPVPVAFHGGGSHSDRVEIWRDGALISWDQSAYVEEVFDREFGPARVLAAPAEPGDYEILYLFGDLDGDEAIAARLPLTVGAADPVAEEGGVGPVDPPGFPPADPARDEAAAGYSCPADHGVPCIFDDSATGLLFALPPGWVADMPTRASALAGDPGSGGPVRMTIQSPARPEPDTLVLNPHQWIAANGPCVAVQAGQLCHFAPASELVAGGLEVLTRALHDRGAPVDGPMVDGPKEDGHGPDDHGAGERAWSDYPHRCLPGDKTTEFCDMRDAASELFFHLPEGWVAEVLTTGPHPHAAFYNAGPGAQSIALNPPDWPDADRACALTRAGTLCANPDDSDPALRRAFDTLRFTLTTGQVLRRCGDEPCTFAHPAPPLSGSLPALWSVEVGRVLPDGRVATWFWNMERDGALRLMGLNQAGGADCLELQPGDRICDFTPGIAEADRALISTMIVPPAPADRRPPDTDAPAQVDATALKALDSLMKDR